MFRSITSTLLRHEFDKYTQKIDVHELIKMGEEIFCFRFIPDKIAVLTHSAHSDNRRTSYMYSLMKVSSFNVERKMQTATLLKVVRSVIFIHVNA